MSARGRTTGAAALAALVATLTPALAHARDATRWSSEPTEVAHEDFYLRVSVGLAETLAGVQSRDGTRTDRARSTGFSLQIAGGSTVARGLVLGGMLSIAHSGAARLPAGTELGTLNVTIVGPFFDFYPDDTRGLHFGLMAGYSTVNYGSPRGGVGKGGGAAVFGGYDLWIADAWSLGVALQLHAALLRGDRDDIGPVDEPYRFGRLGTVLGGSLQLGVLYN